MKHNNKYLSIDLFSGCGGLTTGLKRAGFKTTAAIENNSDAIKAFRLNHSETIIIDKDIRKIKISEIRKILNGTRLHLLAGCPPCQGFSTVRTKNKNKSIRDERNNLIMEYLRFVKKLKPLTIMMENVPGLQKYYLFKDFIKELYKLGYNPKVSVVNVKEYGVPQSRRRLVVVGSIVGNLEIAPVTGKKKTVRDAIGNLDPISRTKDPLHKILASHTPEVLKRIKQTPKNGGSRKDLPKKFRLKCHEDDYIGFRDVYGRLRWDDQSTTITSGCLNPSKGRFLHPTANRVITPREAALLQSFPKSYKFPIDVAKQSLALMIGNALPPKFSYYQSLNIKKHLDKYLNQS